mmetsp:Transcript_64854/g.154846  ORF Transcript_64854/g.154846 Transcript_64854/m.154846 type:complete len:895 (+) Transcript_64854:123-2807(+)
MADDGAVDLASVGMDGIDAKDPPVFANEENKQLALDVKRKEGELDKLEEKLHTDGERVKVMTDHLINVQQELVHTQQLVDAKKNEIATEEHIKALTNRKLGRAKADIVKLQKEVDDTQDRTNAISNELMRGNEKLDQFKLEMNWNQEELEQWAIAAKQKEEDERALEKYHRADETKVRELTMAIEKLTYENAQRQKELADQVTDTQAKQIEMDKTAEVFRQLHEERRKLISQWEEAVKNMKIRDNQLERLGEEYASNLGRKRTKEDHMKEKRKQHVETEAENEKLEQGIATGDRQLIKMRMEHMNIKGDLGNFKDEVEVVRNQLSSCEAERNNAKNQLAVLKDTLEKQKAKHAAMLEEHEQHKQNLEVAIGNSKDKAALSAEAEKAREQTLANLRQVEKEMKLAKENLFKESQDLYKLRAEESTTLGEISGAQSAIKNLQFQISKLDAERQRQQELLYAVDFQSQLMQRKVARVSGERTIEEKEEFNRKIDQLEKQMKEQKGLHTVLSAQNKRQDAELKNANRALQGVQKDSENMRSAMEELELQNTVMNRSVANTVKEKEDSLMQHDVLRLEVKRLRQQLNNKSENLFGLENRKQQLHISMQEREKEIEVHQEVLRSQLRSAEEERHKAAIELAERRQKIYTLKMKYENVVGKVKKGDGEEGKSQAYYVLKAAQAKEELQRKGDELDDKIRKAEREMRALENTLGHLVQRNRKYKENFQTANTQSQAEFEEKQMLEEQSRAANEVLFKKKKTLAQLEREEQEDNKRLDELQASHNKLGSQCQQLEAANDSLTRDMEAQEVKLGRADQMLDTWKRKAADAGVDMSIDSAVSMDIETRSLRDQNQSVLFALANALQDHPEDVLPLFHSLCNEKGLVLPSRPPSAGGSRPSSGRGP